MGSGENAYTTAAGNSGINFEIRNAATVSNFTMTGNSVTGNFADGMQISPAASTTGSLTATIQNNSFSNNNIALDLNSAASADMTYKVLNNTFENTARNATGGIGGASHMINLFMDTHQRQPAASPVRGQLHRRRSHRWLWLILRKCVEGQLQRQWDRERVD